MLADGEGITMQIRYYLDWFYEKGFTDKLVSALNEDIVERKSLVMIAAESYDDTEEQVSGDNIFEKTWFDQADIFFDEYHLIDSNLQKEAAQRLIQEASVIFLCGGYPQYQMRLLKEYALVDLIEKSKALVMGTSAGGMNMSDEYFDYANKALIEERRILSGKMAIYVAADKEGALRVRAGKLDIIGNVYLISQSDIQKLVETI